MKNKLYGKCLGPTARKVGWVDPSTPESKQEIDKLREQMMEISKNQAAVVIVSDNREFYAIQQYRLYKGFDSIFYCGVISATNPLYVSVDFKPQLWEHPLTTGIMSEIYKFGTFFDRYFPQKLKDEIFPPAQPAPIETPTYYDNSKGSLYKISQDRGWNSYVFDAVKRLDRGGKKDPLRQEVEKTIALLQLWLKEMED